VRAARATPAYAERLAQQDPDAVTTRAALAALPVTRKHELLERQIATRTSNTGWDPFGGFSAIGWRALGQARRARRVYQSPGPVYEPEGPGADYWRLRARHVRRRLSRRRPGAQQLQLPPDARGLDHGKRRAGAGLHRAFPAAWATPRLQLAGRPDLRADAYTGTPSFLRILLEKAAETGVALPHLKKALVSGEAFPAALRDWLTERGVAGLPVLCHRRRRPDRLRDHRAPGPGGRRRRDRRDRAARHWRPGAGR
jgi:phenylacetate-CoA ligase